MRPLFCIALVSVLAGACAKRAATTPPADASKAEEAQPRRLEDLERELAEARARLDASAHGGEAAPADGHGASGKTASADDDASEPRCTEICEIAATICDLRDHICALADDHTDEPRYAAACERASTECARATEACDGCED